jgi:hypothetical protein
MTRTSRQNALYAFGTCLGIAPTPKSVLQRVAVPLQRHHVSGSDPIFTPIGVVGGIFHE